MDANFKFLSRNTKVQEKEIFHVFFKYANYQKEKLFLIFVS